MGIAPSKTELYFPSDTIRLCTPDRCSCDRRHSSPKYLYVERGGDGRERYRDPVDMMGDYFMGRGPGVPWRDVREWTVRDLQSFGDVFNEWQSRERGRGGQNVPHGFVGPGPGPVPGGYGMAPPPPYDGGYAHRMELERMGQAITQRFQELSEQNRERDAFLFGSEQDRWKERYRQNMLKTMQEIMPQMAGMMGGQGGPMGANLAMMGGAWPGMMAGQFMGGGGGNMMPPQTQWGMPNPVMQQFRPMQAFNPAAQWAGQQPPYQQQWAGGEGGFHQGFQPRHPRRRRKDYMYDGPFDDDIEQSPISRHHGHAFADHGGYERDERLFRARADQPSHREDPGNLNQDDDHGLWSMYDRNRDQRRRRPELELRRATPEARSKAEPPRQFVRHTSVMDEREAAPPEKIISPMRIPRDRPGPSQTVVGLNARRTGMDVPPLRMPSNPRAVHAESLNAVDSSSSEDAVREDQPSGVRPIGSTTVTFTRETRYGRPRADTERGEDDRKQGQRRVEDI